MSKVVVRRTVLPLGVLALFMGVFALPGAGRAAEPSLEAAQLDCYTHADGTNYFGLAVKPSAAPSAGGRDLVVLFDTSASQAGQYRSDALASLGDLLSQLGPEDRVRLIAVDLHAIPMTKGFVAPKGPEMEKALEKLNRREPLGSTDMEKALSAAVESFGAASQSERAAVYLGDGMSTAQLLGTEEFKNLTGRLVDARIPLSSCPIGPKVDLQLLGALAANTGGRTIDLSEQAGQELADAVHATVYWPGKATIKNGELYPERFPPLRSDRASVVVGKLDGQGPIDLELSVTGPGGPQKLTLAAPLDTPDEDNAYLVELFGRAKADGGVSLPLVGAESLVAARDEINLGVMSLTELAEQALASGSLDHAAKLADAALEADPDNAAAKAVKDAVAKRLAEGGGPAPAGPVAAGPPAAGPPMGGGVIGAGGVFGADDLNLIGGGPVAAEGAFAEAFGQERRIVAQVIKTQVQNAVNAARGQMGTDPDGAIQNLKLTLETVKQAPDLDPEVRDQLVDVIQAALRAASRRKVEVEQRRQEIHERIAADRERALINENLLRDYQKLRQLMQRFDALMKDGEYRLAEEGAAAEAARVSERLPLPREPGRAALPEVVSATLQGRSTGYLHDALALRVARQKGVVDALYQVEKSHVPFPDEPPIVYPDAQVWQELTARRSEKYKSMDLASRGAAEKKIDEALDSPTQLEFIETPLQDVIDYLKDFHDIEIQIDKRALEGVGLGTDTPITKNLKGISLRSALKLLLREQDLTYVVQDEVLLITTQEEVENNPDYMSVKVYPVADLVLPIRDAGFSGGFGGLGGYGGFGASMGGMGMQGGAFNRGMGGMGMGMMNVPREFLPQVPAGGFRAFSVKDDLSKPPAEVPQRKSVDEIRVDLPEGAKPAEVWDDYFRTHDPAPMAVLKTTRWLVEHKRYDHAIALIQAALCHGEPRPWMYESLVVAMQMDHRPQEEIERAIMSAVDFMENPADLMHVGAYMLRLGLQRRALSVFREVSEIVPTWPEPYMLGLRAARQIDDLEAIQWATVGILSQEWTEDQADVRKTGMYVAAATLERLKREGRQSEAREYEAALNAAVCRDVYVVVSWTGEADVDLLVEEPSGTVCSVRNPRTTAGGVMLGDSFARLDDAGTDGYREVYVCPQGFNGSYRVLLRRVWGKVTGDKVHVEVINHHRTKNPVREARSVSLKNDKAVVLFDLQNGRRAEPLEQHQIVNAALSQIALNRQVGRHILAQQLAAAADPGVARSLAMARQGTPAGNFPFFARGAVGYQPVIITLPEGANMAATAVVSADRRYVRITVVPLFSGVSEVNVFNSATGANTQGRGGTGGQGFSQLFGGGGFNQNNQNNNNNPQPNPNPNPQPIP